MTKPTATGTLASTPFCELLVYALTQCLTGSLVLECPDHTKHALLLNRGAPVKSRVDNPGMRLGEVLLARGCIDVAARRAAEAGPEGQLFGQRLFSNGALDAATLSLGLTEQLLEQLSWLSRAPPPTGFAYYADTDLLQSWGGEHLQIDPLAGIWRAVRASASGERLARALAGLGGKTLRLHPASRIGRFGFTSRERSVLDVLRVKPQTLAELQGTGLCELPTLHKLLYVLVLTRHLDTGELPLGVSAGTQPVISTLTTPRRYAPPSSAKRPAVAAVKATVPKPSHAGARELVQTGRFLSREEIDKKHQSLEQLDFYALLEVPRAASAEELAAAFPMLARRWHPDRLSPELTDLKDSLTRVFARMTEAHRVLGQVNSRQEYDGALLGMSEQEAEQAEVVKVLRAAEAFQKAEILLRKRDLDGAEKFAAVAFAGDNDQPEYAALYAWIRARRPAALPEDINESLNVLRGAVGKQGDNVKIRYYLACVLKLAGQDQLALREFRFVAERDPSNLDAVRELRLHDMRKQNQPVASDNSGLFGRLFKR